MKNRIEELQDQMGEIVMNHMSIDAKGYSKFHSKHYKNKYLKLFNEYKILLNHENSEL